MIAINACYWSDAMNGNITVVWTSETNDAGCAETVMVWLAVSEVHIDL